MHAFAQKPKATRQTASTSAAIPGRARLGRSPKTSSIPGLLHMTGNQSLQRRRPSGDEEHNAALTEPASPRFGHDFSRIPIHPPAAPTIQTKLAISSPGDSYEREADEVADKVMRIAEPAPIKPAPAAIQRMCADCEEREKKRIQTKLMPSAHAGAGLDAGAAASAAVRGGTPLSTELRAYFEPRFGQDFSQVRIHADGAASNAARSVEARAYTYGSHIVFGAGEYAPATAQGKRLLAHELTHVIQQGGGGTVTQSRAAAAQSQAEKDGTGGSPVRHDRSRENSDLPPVYSIQQGPPAAQRKPLSRSDPPTPEYAGGGSGMTVTRAYGQGNSFGNANFTPASPDLRSGPAVFRSACTPAVCPPVEFPVPAYGVIWQEAERCLQERYKDEHPGNTIGFATSWVGLTGKTPHEEATIDFFRSHYTGKGFKPKKDPQNQFPDNELEREGSGQRQAEPDIFDFTDQVILEITTPAGVPYRAQKIVWEVDEATKLMMESGIGGKQLWAPGFWQPRPCYTMPGSNAKGYYRAWNQGGVLTYLPVSDVTNEAYLAAIAAAVAAAGKAMSKGNKGSGPPPVASPAPVAAYALLIVAAVALAILLLPEELVAAAGLAILRIGAALLTLLGGGSLAFAGEGGGAGSGPAGGPGGQPGGTAPTGTTDGPGGTGGSGGAGGTKANGPGTGSGTGPGSAGAQKQGSQSAGGGKTPAPSGTTATGSAPYNETLHKLMELIQQLNLKDGDKISPEDAERILTLGEELLKQLEAADPNDPNAVALKDLIAGIKPKLDQALKKVQAAKGAGGDKKDGGAKRADEPGSGSKDTRATGTATREHDTTGQNANPGADSSTNPKPKRDDSAAGKGGAGKDPGMRKDPSAISGSGLKPVSDEEAGDFKFQAFQFGISGFDPTVSRKKGDPVRFTINGVVKNKGFHAEVTGSFDHVEVSGDTIITYVELPSVLIVEGTDPPQAIAREVKLITTKKK